MSLVPEVNNGLPIGLGSLMPLSGKRKPYAALNLDFISSSALPNTVTFSRGTAATQYDSTGALTQAPHNLLTYSEQFDNAAWTKTNTTVTPNTIVAPDGTLTADKIVPNATNADHTVSGSAGTAAAAGVVYTVSVYAKAGEYNFIRLSLGGVAGGGFTFFNVATGAVGTTSGMLSNSISSVGGGWYRCSVTRAATSSAGIAGDVYVISADNQFSWSGDGTSGVYLWGAQLEQRSTAWAYNATTSAAYYGPRFDYDPASLVYQNLLTYSEQFDNAAWTKTNTTVTPNAATAPDGTVTMDALVESTANTQHYIGNPAVPAGTYTYSMYIKGLSSGRYFILEIYNPTDGSSRANFDPFTGATTFTAGGVTATTTSVGNGIYRVTVSATKANASTCYAYLSNSSTSNLAYTGDGTSGVYIWGAQLNTGSTALPYYATTSAAYTQCAPNGLLIEEQRTNSIRNNTMQGAVAGTPGTAPTNWTIFLNGITGVTLSVVGTGVQNGVSYIDVRANGTPSATGAQGVQVLLETNSSIAASASQVWTQSAWVSIAAGSSANISGFVHNVQQYNAGVFVQSNNTSFTPTSTLTRYNGTVTFSASTTTNALPCIAIGVTSGQAIDITLRIGLPQLELGAFATSVIPTYGAAATRNADTASMTGTNFSSWYNPVEGTLFAQADLISASYSQGALVDIGAGGAFGTTEYINWGGTSWSLNPNAAPINVLSSVSTGSSAKIAAGIKANDSVIAANGLIGTVDTSCAVAASPTTLSIGKGGWSAGNYLNGWVRSIRYYPTRLPNATLQGLTV